MWTNLLTLELIEQNESYTRMKRDCKAKGKGSSATGGGGGAGEYGRVFEEK